MTAQTRKAIVEALSKRIQADGFIKLNALSRIFDEEGLDRSLYAATGPKRWIKEQLPEFIVVGSNGRETLRLSKDPLARIYQILEGALDQNGQILLSAIPQRYLSPEGINYRDYTMGKKMSEWLPAAFPEFSVSDDNLWLYKKGNTAPAPAPAPVQPTLSDEALAEVQQMHKLAFMNWWNTNVRKLRTYNAELNTENQVKAAVAHRMGSLLLGSAVGFIDARQEEEPRTAFDTGLKSQSGSPIYSILGLNPRNAGGGKQKWVLLDFACPEENSPLGQWLREHRVIPAKSAASFSALEQKVHQVDERREELLPVLRDYLEVLSQGRIPTQEVSEAVKGFESQAAELRQLFREAWNMLYPEEATIQQVSERVGGKTAVLQRLKTAVELFDAVTKQTEDMFVQDRLPVGETSVSMQDREAIHRQYDTPTEDIDFRLFEDVLKPYRALRQVMEATELSDEIDTQIDSVLCRHFPEISYRFAVRFLIKSEESEWSYLRQLDQIEEHLRACRVLSVPKVQDEPEERKRVLSAEEMLDVCLQEEVDGVDTLEWARSIFPENVPERLLVLGQMEKFRDYLEKHPEENTYSPEQIQAAADPVLPRELTYPAAAERLFRVEGNRGRLSEKYYMLGLSFGEQACAAALLRLYREAEDQTAFRKVWLHGGAEGQENSENQVFYLSILCQHFQEDVRAYVRENLHLLYRQESLALLLELPEGVLDSEEIRQLRARLERLKAEPEPNPLEQAVIAGDLPQIRQLAANQEGLSFMGYDEEEIQRIVQAAAKETAGDCESREEYAVGIRLYRFQKNLHGLAEQYMWSGIAKDRQIRASQLMLMLAQEGRWQECCDLYEANQKSYGEDIRCRQAYLIARLRLDPVCAQEYVRDHLQDCLWMMESVPMVRSAVQEMVQPEEPEGGFYGQVLALDQELQDPLVKSVVLQDRMLRELATEAYAREKGVPEAYARRIGEVYRSDSYARGMDAASVTERAYQFFGSYRGVAETLARFALPEIRGVEVLWNLYQEMGDEDLQFQLLEEYPDLRKGHLELYGTMLFRREAYEEFLAQCLPAEGDWGWQLQAFIAELKLHPETKAALPSLPEFGSEEALEWFQHWGSLLTEALVETGRQEDLEMVLLNGFSGWLDVFPEELLRELVTGRETAGPELLEAVQQEALAQDRQELALYLYQTLGVGEVSDLAKQFQEKRLAELETASSGEKLRVLRQLQRLSSGTVAENARIPLLQIQLIQENPALSSEEEAEEIGNVLQNYPASPEAVEQLLPLLEDPELFLRYPVYAGLAQIAEKLETPQAVLCFFQRMVRLSETEENNEYRRFVCCLLVKAFDQGVFPGDSLSETEEWCIRYVSQYQTADGILCLYFVEKAQGREAFAAYLLRVLADQSAERVGEELGHVLSAQLHAVWKGNLPSYFDLFKEYLMQVPVEEVEGYIAFAHLTTGMEVVPQTQALDMERENRMLSESESNALVRLLYANPEEAEVWKLCTKLPLQDNPVGYAKLLFMACQHQAASWQECAEYCEKYEQWELLLRVLLTWAESVPVEDVSACRIYLENRLTAYPDYLARWSGKTELLELSNVLCSRVKQSEVEYHATLRSVSLIAVKTGFPEAVGHLMDRFGYTLLGNCCNLGVVMAVHLLLDTRYEEAQELLIQLKNVLGNMNYREMVDSLADMSVAELVQWTENAENKIMLNLILPDGNSPNLQQINTITYEGMQSGQTKETAHVLCRMLTMFPNDYGMYNALFDLCCTEFEGFLPLLHQSLRGLVRLQPNRNAQSYYRRTKRHYARMLAALDALVLANGATEQIPDYDFSEGTVEYYRRVSPASLPYGEFIEVSSVREHVSAALYNQVPGERERLSLGYRSCITGNWFELLQMAWEKKWDIQSALSCGIEQVEDLGFGHSVLRLLLRVPQEQREDLILWLRQQLRYRNWLRPQNARQRQLQFVGDFLKEGCFDQLENQIEFGSLESILNNPFEDYSFSVLLGKYVDAAIKKDSEQLFALTWLLGALICHNGYQIELSKRADQLFEMGDDRRAYSLYRAMYLLCITFKMIHSDIPTGEKSPYDRRIREGYEGRYRITALFSRNREMMARVGASDFHVWSCINLVLTLAHSGRADEIMRLCTYLSKENAFLAEMVMRGLDPQVSDQEKLEAVDKLYNDVVKAYYCYVIKYPYNPSNKKGTILHSICISNSKVADELNHRYVILAQTLMAQNDPSIHGMSPSHYLLLENRPADSKISHQKDPMLWSTLEETVDSSEKESLEDTPFFAEGEEPLQSQEKAADLMAEHRKIQNLAGTVEAKEALSRKIYRICLASGSQAERRDALLLLGCDCYYAALSRNDLETANRAVLALAALQKHSEASGYGGEMARKTLPNGLYSLILSFQTLRDLLVCYGEHRSLFHYLRSLLDDALLIACVGQIYTVLDNLRNCYSSAARENPETLREELSVNYRQLENIETNRWMNLKNKVQKLINDEINELDQRPMLQFTVFSMGVQRPFGTLSGQVRNIGQATAWDVVIQASYSDNSHSKRYVLSSLAPGGQAVFEVDYDCEPDLGTLRYYLSATFSHNGKLYPSVVAKGELELRDIEPPTYQDDLLCRNPNGIAFRVHPETGEVYSPEFVGRKEETAFLRSLVEEEFVSCRSALIYGIRRTGKSSLLNYLATYIRASRPQILCVQTDCQNMRNNDPIQYVFVDRVLDEVETKLPEMMADSRWLQLKERWHSPAYCADQEPERLCLFYRQLNPVLDGRGVYLIIDEIDRLFQRVEENRQGENHRNLDGLFGALSEMLNQVECKEAVHFVICGSNWLIRYNLKGEKINQLFQRFGKQVIEVGKLPEADMQEVIRRPYKQYPELCVTPEAMQWIWNYTGGLVWHTKVLAQEAIGRAKRDCRCRVYPADVQQSIPYVVTEEWCKQFYEGCESGEEFKVIDAMQSLAANRNTYIHIDRIRELLGHDLLEIQRTMLTLQELKVVAQHPVNQQLYCFEQDLYRRYFRTRPSRYPRVPDEPDVFQAIQQVKEPEPEQSQPVLQKSVDPVPGEAQPETENLEREGENQKTLDSEKQNSNDPGAEEDYSGLC